MSHQRGFRDHRGGTAIGQEAGDGMPSAFQQPPSTTPEVPVFTQSHVDYLRAVFRLDLGTTHPAFDAEACLRWVASRYAELGVIHHIQSLVDNQRGTGR